MGVRLGVLLSGRVVVRVCVLAVVGCCGLVLALAPMGSASSPGAGGRSARVGGVERVRRLSVRASVSVLATPQLTIERVSYDYAKVLLTVSDDVGFSVWVDQNGHHECPQSLAAGSYQIECVLVLDPTDAPDVKGAASDTQVGPVYGTDNLITPLPSDVPWIYDVQDSQPSPSVWQSHSVSAWVDPEGANTTWHAAYGTTPSLGTDTPDNEIFQSPPVAGTDGSEVSIDGLSPSTTYYYSFVATNINGTTTSPVQSFTTVAAGTTTPNTSLNYAPAHFQATSAAPGGSGTCAFTIYGDVVTPNYAGAPFQAQISVGGGAVNVSIGTTFQNADGTYHGVSYAASGYGSETCGAGSAGYGLQVTASLTTSNAVVEDSSGHELGTFTMTVSFDNLYDESVPAAFSAEFTPASAVTTTTAPATPPSTSTAQTATTTVPSTTTATTTATTTTTRSSSGAPPKPSLATFAAPWVGHDRRLTIARDGRATETILESCCQRAVTLRFHITKVSGTSAHPVATARVTYVRVFDRGAYSKKHPAPHVGETGTLRIINGVLHEPLGGATYCNSKSKVWVCGA